MFPISLNQILACVGTLDGKMDSPQQSGFLHSSYGRRAAQLCHCETPPVQWTKHCCHPADKKGGGKRRRESETQIKQVKREKSEFIDPKKQKALQFEMDHVIVITHNWNFFQPFQHPLYYN